MELNFREMARLVDVRKAQISDASLEYDYFNEEYLALEKIRAELAKLILLERDQKRLENEIKEHYDQTTGSDEVEVSPRVSDL